MITTTFSPPKKTILTREDLENFLKSETFQLFVDFVNELSDSVRDKSLKYPMEETPIVQELIGLLDLFESWIPDFPLLPVEKSRFGNAAFRGWIDRVVEKSRELLIKFVPVEAVIEPEVYLINSFGDRKRIDYGTGHEASFIAFLYCLKHLNVISESDYPAIVLRVFWRYIGLMRSLQSTFWLEPAGSHGVWGLDDYHFLPFMFGASQLYNHKFIRPRVIHQQEIVKEIAHEYMYLACIEFINQVKTDSLKWHSPMLNDISGVKTWKKIHEGMQKMYVGEVLSKLPIMQHFRFGGILPFEASVVPEDTEDGHVHVHAFGQEFPTCCGIRIPSAIAAAKSAPNGKLVISSAENTGALPFD